MCFNDEKVQNWSIENLERDCFGGEYEQNGRKYENRANAFMVFYERTKKVDTSDVSSAISLRNRSSSDLALDDGEETKISTSIEAGSW